MRRDRLLIDEMIDAAQRIVDLVVDLSADPVLLQELRIVAAALAAMDM